MIDNRHIKVVMMAAVFAILIFLGIGVDAYSAELLGDNGFELSNPTGAFPDSGYWQSSTSGGTAGAVCTSTAAMSGRSGLWVYTADVPGFTWSGTYQEFSAAPGQSATASAWIRTPQPGTGVGWSNGSRACVRVEFLSSSGSILAYNESAAVTTANSGWGYFSVATGSAPSGTARVRYRCYIEKPSNGVTTKSVANFDNCSLSMSAATSNNAQFISQSVPSTMTVGQNYNVSVTMKNIGSSTWTSAASYRLGSQNPQDNGIWGTGRIYMSSGDSIAPGASKTFTFTVKAPSAVGNYNFQWRMVRDGVEWFGGYSTNVTVGVTSLLQGMHSVVTVNGYRLIVQRRNSDGTLSPAENYIMKGVAWAPASVGTAGSVSARRAEFAKWVDTDVIYMKDANINTVRTYIDFGSSDSAITILNKLYQNGIMVVMGIDGDGWGDVSNALQVVNKCKNHPAILMWLVGNEWNINCYNTVDPAVRQPTQAEIDAAAQKTRNIVTQIKAADPNHLVATAYGEPLLPSIASTQNYVRNICANVDVWGVNVYRGSTFGSLFNDWKTIGTKPMFLSEFGTDSYRAYYFGQYPITGAVDEQMQADYDIALWNNMFQNLSARNSSMVCIGGAIFSWCDEWWKVSSAYGGDNNRQDNGGYYTTWNSGAFPDGCGNEEYFGIVTISRSVKVAYNALKAGFSPQYVPNSNVYSEDRGTDAESAASWTMEQ